MLLTHKNSFVEREFRENPQNMHAMLKINGLKPDTSGTRSLSTDTMIKSRYG